MRSRTRQLDRFRAAFYASFALQVAAHTRLMRSSPLVAEAMGDELVGLARFRHSAGMLCTSITAAAWCLRASMTTSRGWTLAPSRVPRKRSWAAMKRWRLSTNGKLTISRRVWLHILRHQRERRPPSHCLRPGLQMAVRPNTSMRLAGRSGTNSLEMASSRKSKRTIFASKYGSGIHLQRDSRHLRRDRL